VHDGHTETYPLDLIKIRLIAIQGRINNLQALLGQDMAAGIYLFQFPFVVHAISPEPILIDGHGISHSEIVKGAEQFFFQCLRKPDFSGKPVAEISGHIASVHSFRRCRQSKQDFRIKVIKYRPVTGSGAVVSFINDDIIVKISAHLLPQSSVG